MTIIIYSSLLFLIALVVILDFHAVMLACVFEVIFINMKRHYRQKKERKSE